MTPARDLDREIFVYLALVVSLSAVVVAMLYGLFTAGLSAGIQAFLEDPVEAMQDNPLGVAAVVGVHVAIVALFATIVVFGARYSQREQTRRRDERRGPPK